MLVELMFLHNCIYHLHYNTLHTDTTLICLRLQTMLQLNKWYFDEIYQSVFVMNALKLGNILSIKGDKKIIDGMGPDGIANLSRRAGANFGRFQTGYIYHYAFVMMLGLVGIISWIIYRIYTG